LGEANISCGNSTGWNSRERVLLNLTVTKAFTRLSQVQRRPLCEITMLDVNLLPDSHNIAKSSNPSKILQELRILRKGNAFDALSVEQEAQIHKLRYFLTMGLSQCSPDLS
jgi:hypothetical protein